MKITRPKSLAEMVVEELRGRIVDGRLELGAPLSENTLAAELGLSKTPVREALLQLKQERLVEVLPQRGTYVFRLAADQVVQISELREVLELAALDTAMARNRPALVARLTEIIEPMRAAFEADDIVGYRTLDGRFHQVIVELSGNAYFAEAYSPIGLRIQALRSRLSTEPRLNRRSMKEHQDILRLIRAGDVAQVQALMRAHIEQTRRSYLDVMEQRDAPDEAVA